MQNEKRVCYAPVFPASSRCSCMFKVILMAILLPVWIIMCLLLALITFGAYDAGCCIKRYLYQMNHCTEGNRNPGLII
jgi:hypothetical protein